MSKRAVLYARVSGDDRGKEGRNLAGQLEMGREHAQEHAYKVVAELAEDDRGASGYEINLPKLNRAREMAAAGEFDVLVVRELDRLSRNLAKQLVVEEELKRHGVKVEYVLAEYPDTPEGNLQKHVKAVIAEYEREKIKERMVRGRRLKAKAGHVVTHGRAPYGYKLTEVDGKRTLEIYEPEARIVRMIFQWYTKGDDEDKNLSLIKIAKRLTKMRVPTQGDTDDRIAKQREYGEWNRTAIRKMLKRETYAGVFHYGKVKRNNGCTVKNPRETWIPVEVPAIVSREVWEAAQRQLKENRETARRNLKYEYLLRCRVTCASCGASMCGKTVKSKGKLYSYYQCAVASGRLDYAHGCNQREWFRADQVDAAVWKWVGAFLTDPSSLRVGLKEYQAEQDRANAPLRERLAIVEDLLADNQRQLERLLELYLIGGFPREVLVERKNRLEDTIRKLEKERKALVAQLETQTLTEEQVESLENFALRVAEGLEHASEDFETQQRVIEMLDVRATLAVEDSEKVVYLQCVLGEDSLSVERTNT
jgi:site-specific DNA recombinase